MCFTPAIPETKRGKGSSKGEVDPLKWTGIFTAGLKMGIPYMELVRMRVPVLLMMLESQMPMESNKKGGVRKATQRDIDAFASF